MKYRAPMDDYNTEKIREALQKRAARREALAKAWAGVHRCTKKNGENFARYAQNFAGDQLIITPRAYGQDGQLELRIWIRDARGVMQEDSLTNYEILSHWQQQRREELEQAGAKITTPGSIWADYATFTPELMEVKIKNRSDYWQSKAQEAREALEKFDTLAEDLREKWSTFWAWYQEQPEAFLDAADEVLKA